MPAVVACPKCKAKYNLPDQLIGKPVQCKACSTRFQVGQPRKALPDKSAGKAVVANPVSPQQRAEMAKLGIDGPFQPRPDLFVGGPISPADPLANHVVEDPGFATSDIEIQESEATEQEEQDDFAAVFINPAIAAPKKANPKKIRWLNSCQKAMMRFRRMWVPENNSLPEPVGSKWSCFFPFSCWRLSCHFLPSGHRWLFLELPFSWLGLQVW